MEINQIRQLIDIAEQTEQDDLLALLENLASDFEDKSRQILVPLIGEFSSGKTSLINALTDSKSLKVASRAETSVIYQVFFGQNVPEAKVIYDNGDETDADISSLDNDALASQNARFVQIFDTSNKVAQSTVLIDTPGLSSQTSEHKQALLSILPKADVVLLFVDVNQGLTSSLVRFIKDNAMINRPLYLVLTKADTKTPEEVEKSKRYIQENIRDLNIKKIVTISSHNDDISQLTDILAEIDRNKASIIEKVSIAQIKNVAKMLSSRIDELLQTAKIDDNDIDKSIKDMQTALTSLKNSIQKIMSDLRNEFTDVKETVCEEFTGSLNDRLYNIVKMKNGDMNDNFNSTVQSISVWCFENYKSQITEVIAKKTIDSVDSQDGIELSRLKEVSNDLPDITIDSDIDIKSIGHQNDDKIAGAINVGVGVAAVLGTIFLGVPGGIVGAGEGAIALGGALHAAKGVQTMAVAKKVSKGTKAMIVANKIATEAKKLPMVIDNTKHIYSDYTQKSKGPVSKIVSALSEMASKPQKVKAISEFIEYDLVPAFTAQLNVITDKIISDVVSLIEEETKFCCERKAQLLNDLKEQKKSDTEAYNNKIRQYTEYKETALKLSE